MSRKGNGVGQSVAEWITLGISVAVLLVLIGLVGYEYFTSGVRPPVIEVKPQVEGVREVDGTYYLPVEVINEGERTAGDVKVRVTLTSDVGERESSVFTIAFLAGEDTEQEVVVFEESPTGGDLAAEVESFRKP